MKRISVALHRLAGAMLQVAARRVQRHLHLHVRIGDLVPVGAMSAAVHPTELPQPHDRV